MVERKPKMNKPTKLSQIETNPFQQPPILEVLFKHCDVETLKVVRQVCKLWKSSSTTAFQNATQINFYSMNPQTYSEMMTCLQEGYRIEPTNVALTLSPLYGEPVFSQRHLTVCPWSACDEFIFPNGSSIQCLKFYAWDLVSNQLDGQLFSQLLLTPLCLKTLEISLLPSSITSSRLFPRPWSSRPPLCHLTNLVMYGKMDCSQEFIYDFLGAMPNVRSITVNCCSAEFLDVFCPAFSEIPLKTVEHLKLNFVAAFNQSHISQIERANLRLKTLHAAQRSSVSNFEMYTQLMRTLAPSLEDAKLTCCTSNLDQEHFLTLPTMPRLKTLRVHSWRTGHAVWNLDFINYLPNLESLTLERRGLGVCYIPGNFQDHYVHCFLRARNVEPHEKLRSLVLPIMPMLFPRQESISLLLPKFKNLANLTLSANDECLNCVFQAAPQLQELVVAEYSKITNAGITGLVFGCNNGGGDHSSDDHETFQNFNVNLGITALKGLRKLELDGFGGRVTDDSIKHGIVHLEKLQSVIFRCCKITDCGIKMLSRMQVTVVNHDNVHIFTPEE